MILLVYMSFVLGAAITTLFVLVKYHSEPKKKAIVCPETKMPAAIEVDRRHALVTLLKGTKELKVKDCSRWPDRLACDEDCLAQLEFGPRSELILGKWCKGKSCAMCAASITPVDWQRGRAGVLDSKNSLLELRDMDWKQFPMILDECKPLCWNCHQAELHVTACA